MDLNLKFYNELSEDYHLIFDNWESAIEHQAVILDHLIKNNSNGIAKTVLDCACGIGTQAIGLARKGYNVVGTDLSPKAIERANIEANDFNVSVSFDVVDFRELERKVPGKFDVVMACDNALPHLLNKDDFQSALINIKSKMNTDGLFIASFRDYDSALKTMPQGTQPTVKDIGKSRSISFQIWDWETENIYAVNHFIIKETEGQLSTSKRLTKYKAYTRDEISSLLTDGGFKQIQWLMPESSGYYQPIVIARKS